MIAGLQILTSLDNRFFKTLDAINNGLFLGDRFHSYT